MKDNIDFNKFLFFDGAMGTMLQRYGMKQGEVPEVFNILYPEVIEDIHNAYINAGSDIITTNTFGANRFKLNGTGYGVEEIVKRAVEIGKRAANGKLVALDIGPTGKLMAPVGELEFNEAYGAFREQVIAGRDADLILIETMSDIYEAKTAVLAAKENSNLPVICTMTFQRDGRTLTGTDPVTMVNILQGLDVDALGVNCSLGPKEMLSIVDSILKYSKVPVIVQPNAGLPAIIYGKTVYNIEPVEFAGYCKIMAEKGVTIFGGCCGTNPDFISMLKNDVSQVKPIKRNPQEITAVSSSLTTVFIGDGVKIIGERINPTGKKKLKEALRSNNIEYILREAVNQRDAGADILDVNIGLPEIDEEKVMTSVVKEIQSVISLPLQIDSSSPEVIEKAVRIYNGKPLINSVNGKEEIMDKIFPIAKKYGACIVGLTIDENGIPTDAEGRYRIAEKIINRALEYEIPKENIIIDCLVLTASAQQKEVKETIKAVLMVKNRLKVKITLGVSNVSFGLPERGILNKTFLAAALTAGLDAPILNPLDKEMLDTISAFNVLWNNDREAKMYIDKYSRRAEEPENSSIDDKKDIVKIIIDGLKEEVISTVTELLNEIPPMDIVNNYLIPSLDIVGERFEKGDIFLPQLIQSAETVKAAFEIIKGKMDKGKYDSNLSKGKIVIATVRGDIHDIGKNIVKLLLQNYGFDVYDLGKDVSKEEIIEKIKKEKIKLVGLSALMTTTVKSMEETIKAIRENDLDCRVMVGGAVLNDEYASMIGADYYAKDANHSVKIAQEFFGL